jgi:hypothetical protein
VPLVGCFELPWPTRHVVQSLESTAGAPSGLLSRPSKLALRMTRPTKDHDNGEKRPEKRDKLIPMQPAVELKESELLLFPFADLLIEKRVIVVHRVVGSIVARGGHRGWIVFPFLEVYCRGRGWERYGDSLGGDCSWIDPTMSYPRG